MSVQCPPAPSSHRASSSCWPAGPTAPFSSPRRRHQTAILGGLINQYRLALDLTGYTYREIPGKLFISVKTVQNHVQNIVAKLRMHRGYELMRFAIQRGLNRAPEPES